MYMVLFLVTEMTVQQKIVLVTSSFIVCTFNNFPCVNGFLMDNMCLGGYLACAMIVVVEIGRCCLMVVEVSPSYPVKW